MTKRNVTEKSISKSGEFSIGLLRAEGNPLESPVQYSVYTIGLITKGSGMFKADFGNFEFDSPVLFFATPLQTLRLEGEIEGVNLLQFHGDYYCIEYHKHEVACNGVLFNNIYTQPIIHLALDEYAFFNRIINDLEEELSALDPADAVLTAYLQLVLAKATSIKTRITSDATVVDRDDTMEEFKALIESYYLTKRKPYAYAELLHLSPNTLSKRCKQYFNKTPTELIHERIILEAKKQLHLSRKSVKEIAFSLKFQDEHYFSRFFKKITKVTPVAFRQKTGISIVADLSSSNPV